MNRVRVRGATGCGKSTLAKQLAEHIGACHYDLDYFEYLPGWQKRDRIEFRQMLEKVAAEERWTACGNYTTITSDNIEAAADTIIWLDYSFPIKFWRLIKRTYVRTIRHETCCNGNNESLLRTLFTTDSILWWAITSHRNMRRRCREYVADPPSGKVVLHFTHPRQTAAWLAGLTARKEP